MSHTWEDMRARNLAVTIHFRRACRVPFDWPNSAVRCTTENSDFPGPPRAHPCMLIQRCPFRNVKAKSSASRAGGVRPPFQGEAGRVDHPLRNSPLLPPEHDNRSPRHPHKARLAPKNPYLDVETAVGKQDAKRCERETFSGDEQCDQRRNERR